MEDDFEEWGSLIAVVAPDTFPHRDFDVVDHGLATAYDSLRRQSPKKCAVYVNGVLELEEVGFLEAYWGGDVEIGEKSGDNAHDTVASLHRQRP